MHEWLHKASVQVKLRDPNKTDLASTLVPDLPAGAKVLHKLTACYNLLAWAIYWYIEQSQCKVLGHMCSENSPPCWKIRLVTSSMNAQYETDELYDKKKKFDE